MSVEQLSPHFTEAANAVSARVDRLKSAGLLPETFDTSDATPPPAGEQRIIDVTIDNQPVAPPELPSCADETTRRVNDILFSAMLLSQYANSSLTLSDMIKEGARNVNTLIEDLERVVREIQAALPDLEMYQLLLQRMGGRMHSDSQLASAAAHSTHTTYERLTPLDEDRQVTKRTHEQITEALSTTQDTLSGQHVLGQRAWVNNPNTHRIETAAHVKHSDTIIASYETLLSEMHSAIAGLTTQIDSETSNTNHNNNQLLAKLTRERGEIMKIIELIENNIRGRLLRIGGVAAGSEALNNSALQAARQETVF